MGVEGLSSGNRSAQDQMSPDQTSRPDEMRDVDAERDVNSRLRRSERIAVVLFVVNLFWIYISSVVFLGDKDWAYFAVGISTATATILLLSLLLSIYGMSAYSRFFLAVGIVGTMISVVSLGIKMMDLVSEWGRGW